MRSKTEPSQTAVSPCRIRKHQVGDGVKPERVDTRTGSVVGLNKCPERLDQVPFPVRRQDVLQCCPCCRLRRSHRCVVGRIDTKVSTNCRERAGRESENCCWRYCDLVREYDIGGSGGRSARWLQLCDTARNAREVGLGAALRQCGFSTARFEQKRADVFRQRSARSSSTTVREWRASV